MRLDDSAPRGEPFEDDYPHHRHDETCGGLHWAVERQLSELAQRRYEPAIRRDILTILKRRRTERGGEFVQFDVLHREVGFDHLLVSGELLMTREGYEQRGAQAVLDAHGLTVEDFDCPELAERVVRLSNRDLDGSTLDDVARLLRQRGFSASVDHIVPLGPVIKGIGGAEPAVGPGPFPEYGLRCGGKPARVGIIDCGIAAEIRTDGWLTDIPRGGNIDPLDDLPHPDGYLDLHAGHGTFVAGIVAQVAPDAEVRVYRALDSDGLGSELRVAEAMIRAVKDGDCGILNLSLGGQTPDDVPPVAMSAALDIIADIERERGSKVVIVAAAGNYGDNTPCWPGAFRRVVSVAGLGPDMQPTTWSSRGHWVTCSTIGQGLRSTYVEGRESAAIDPEPDTFPADAWAIWNGTSFAAPQVAGAVARIAQDLDLTPQEALVRLLRAGRPVPDFGQALRILPGL
ncbi:MAG TPA: S8/S53 family peptidase [Rugosimonospora sp.]|nr:S8/S53 family peptidase [Rugosimonospora sp.]